MPKVILTSWEYGFLKVSFTKLQVSLLGLSLKQAHDNTNKLLENPPVSLEIQDEAIAQDFQEQAKRLGANSIIE